MKPRAHLQERGDSPAKPREPLRRLDHPTEDFKQRRLARAVTTDQAHDLAALDLERDVPKRPEQFSRDLLLSFAVEAPKPRSDRRGDGFAQRKGMAEQGLGPLLFTEAVALTD